MKNCSEKSNRSLCSQTRVAQNMKKVIKNKDLKRYDRRVNAVCAPRARREHAARRRSVMITIKTLRARRVDDVGALLERCVHAITGKFDIFGLPFTASQYCFGKVLPV